MSGLYKSTTFQIKLLNQVEEIILYIINKLWVQYSEGKFGFSVQQRIWQAKKDCKRFAYKVGWLTNVANSE
ncbi:MAG: GUN4 domain-containing protein [Nostoc sp.]|uniref:GUN4 domain-containing protein n=1 Tax=Nostoc sp. TaxID=1180 RepID=UPI002FFB0157